MNHDPEDKEVHIPTTGRIGRLAQVIEKETDNQTLIAVMKDVEQYTLTADYAKKAAWIKTAIERLEKLVGREKLEKLCNSVVKGAVGLQHERKLRNWCKNPTL